MKITLSIIKADVGSVGGHIKPTCDMMNAVKEKTAQAVKDGLLIDGMVTHTGDDIAIIMSHMHGNDNPDIHKFAWNALLKGAELADDCGCYGAGEDLLTDAPSSNVRGAGPGVVEITFNYDRKEPRPAETFMFFSADKCGQGTFNLPLFLPFADPAYCSGLMLPKMIKGFSFKIIDMKYAEAEKTITLNAPEDFYKITMLLRDGERFGLQAIYSRTHDEQVVATSADRSHNIKGQKIGKDDPIALVRTQGIFPAPEEVLSPYTMAPYVGGGSRGSHNMPLMPVPINSAITGAYSLPIVSALGFSLDHNAKFSRYHVDFFDNPAWDFTRLKAERKANEMRNQGWSGAAMLPYTELEYNGFKKTVEELLERFEVK